MLERLDSLGLEMDWLQSSLAIGYASPKGLIGHLVLPIATVPTVRTKYPVFEADPYLERDTRHGLREMPRQVSMTYHHRDITLTRHTLWAPQDPAEYKAAMDVGIDLEEFGVGICKWGVEGGREIDTATLLTNTASYAAGMSTTTTAGNGWNQVTSGVSNVDPVVDVMAWHKIIRSKNGQMANTLVLGYESYDAASTNTHMLGRLPGGTGADTKTKSSFVSVEDMAVMFKVENLYIGMSTIAIPDATDPDKATFNDVWPDCAILAITAPPTATPVPAFGRTVCYSAGTVDGEPMLGIVGYETQHTFNHGPFYSSWYDPVIQKNDAGYLVLDLVK